MGLPRSPERPRSGTGQRCAEAELSAAGVDAARVFELGEVDLEVRDDGNDVDDGQGGAVGRVSGCSDMTGGASPPGPMWNRRTDHFTNIPDVDNIGAGHRDFKPDNVLVGEVVHRDFKPENAVMVSKIDTGEPPHGARRELAELAELVDGGERPEGGGESVRAAAENELMRALSRATAAVRDRLKRRGRDGPS